MQWVGTGLQNLKDRLLNNINQSNGTRHILSAQRAESMLLCRLPQAGMAQRECINTTAASHRKSASLGVYCCHLSIALITKSSTKRYALPSNIA